MRRYGEYKDTGIGWLPKLPSHWQLEQLRKYIRQVSKKGYPEKQLLSVTREQGVIVRDTESKEENHNFIPKDLSGYKYVEEGQLVINKMKSWQGAYGVSNYEGIVSPAYIVCDLDFTNKRFFSLALISRNYINFFAQYSKGIRVGQWDLSPVGLKSIPFFEPPLAEQEKIVSYLESKTLCIDAYVRERERELQLLNELKEAEIANVVTRGLNPDVKMKDSKNILLGTIPAHWEERKLKYCFSERTEKNHPEEPILCATQSQGVIPQSMYQNRVVVVNKGFEGLKFVKAGDFVISLRSFEGGIEYAYYQGIISAAYTILTPKEIEYTDYFRLLFKCQPFIHVLQTCVTGIREGQNINYQMLGRKFIPLPPIEEQRAIVAYIEDKCNKVNSLISELEAEIEYLKEYKQKLIADCVTGQINVQSEI